MSSSHRLKHPHLLALGMVPFTPFKSQMALSYGEFMEEPVEGVDVERRRVNVT